MPSSVRDSFDGFSDGKSRARRCKAGQSDCIATLYNSRERRRCNFTREEEVELSLAAKAGDQSARHTLIESQLPWAARIATRYAATAATLGIEFDDLLQSANVGVIRAVDKFEPSRGRLTTYVAWWARRHVLNCLQPRHWNIIAIPRIVPKKHAAKVEAATGVVSLSGDVVCDFADWDAASSASNAGNAGENGDPRCGQATPADIELAAQIADERERMNAAIDALDPRRRKVLRLRLAGVTLSVIGQKMGITRERVRQIEVDAIDSVCQQLGRPPIATTIGKL